MDSRDPLIANNAVYDQGDALFDRHDTIANRLDWLSELDLVYRGRYGLRVSAAAWYDTAYGDRGRSNPNAQGMNVVPNSYANNQFSSYTRRYYAGPSGELLDPFVFGVFDLGDTVWDVKIGRHALVWGESLFGSTHAISYSQVPGDRMKGVANPGASAKETALPVAQASTIGQISPELSLLAQVGFEWKPTRIPEGGTYFGVDIVNQGPQVDRLPMIKGKAGDLGLGLKWSPEWLDGTLGLYARRFDDKNGWLAQPAGAGQTRAVYARDIGLLGVALVKRIDWLLAGVELSYRFDDPLNSSGSAGAAGGYEGARGNTWHGVLNGIVSFSPSAVYDSAFLAAELAWNRLDRVTHNRELYWAKGYNPACASDATVKGCADKQFLSFGLSFTPSWTQVYPGVDISLPMFYSRGISGNAPSNGGGVEGFAVYKDYQHVYNWSAPANAAGFSVLDTQTLDPTVEPRRIWDYDPATRRVREVTGLPPDLGLGSLGSLATFDQDNLFTGPLNQFDFKLVGKREMLIPYNAHALFFDTPSERILTPGHLNPDFVRWEWHRVWVVEATIKPGMKNQHQRKVFYLDEDWSGAGMSDEYDAAGKLVRGLFRPAMPLYDVQVQILRCYWSYDLEKKMYALDQHFGDPGQSFQPREQPFPKLNLKPDALARRGVF